jgi:hypothetical protein
MPGLRSDSATVGWNGVVESTFLPGFAFAAADVFTFLTFNAEVFLAAAGFAGAGFLAVAAFAFAVAGFEVAALLLDFPGAEELRFAVPDTVDFFTVRFKPVAAFLTTAFPFGEV